MDKAKKKQLKAASRAQERRTAYAALPLPVDELRALFDMLDVELPLQGCDHTRRLTRVWLEKRGHAVPAVFAWLDSLACFCDCEALNAEEHLNDAVKGQE